MHFHLFDQILETHVCTSLEKSLVKIGHTVTSSGKIWSGHQFPDRKADVSLVDAAVEQAIAAKPDVLFNFRASTLLPDHIRRLRSAGIRTMVWQPDDPVLYAICYSHVMDEYDDVFLCAGRRVLDFYHYKGHKPAINFPFWVDTNRYAYSWDQEKQGDAVFLGNGIGEARRERYQALCGIADDISLYGRFEGDPHGKVRGYLSEDQIVPTVGRYRIGINLAQSFASYSETKYNFPGLGLLGYFVLPSRVVQYASIGLPTLTIQENDFDPMHYPPGLRARNFVEGRSLLATALASPDRLQLLSNAARQYALKHLDADCRARLLDLVCRDAVRARDLSDAEKNYLYKWIS